MSREPLGKELARLEREDPVVGEAARRLDETIERIVTGRVDAAHPIPCTREHCEWHS